MRLISQLLKRLPEFSLSTKEFFFKTYSRKTSSNLFSRLNLVFEIAVIFLEILRIFALKIEPNDIVLWDQVIVSRRVK